jgi:diguanylate cyclase (GGDEF)-like protein/PAS domain S-box-containing protein
VSKNPHPDAGGELAHWGALLDGLPLAAWVVSLADRQVVAINDAACKLLGRERDRLLGAPAATLLATAEDLAWWEALDDGNPGSLQSETVLCDPAGRLLRVERSIRPLTVADPPSRHLLVTLRDRSDEQQHADELESTMAELRATLESTADGILVTDLAGRIRSFNRRFAQIWDLPESALAGDDQQVYAWMRGKTIDPAAYQHRLDAIKGAVLLSGTARIDLQSGRVLECVSRPLWQRGRPAGRVYSFRDLTEQLAADRRIEELATTDALTGLPNRRRLAERVKDVVAQAARSGAGFALMLVDIDRFRQINDSLGHAVGDEVLRTMGHRILNCLRGGDELARVGSDQFAMLVPVADAAGAETLARRVLQVVAQPCNVNGAQFTLTCSIGVALYPQHGASLDELLRHAESAMRAVKGGGRANYRLHPPRAQDDPRLSMKLDHAMRQALAGGRLRLNYQPQIDLGTGQVVGAEALLRWHDPELGELLPIDFIPVAEETGFIIAIGDWVLSQALRQAALWHKRGTPVPIAVNVSALQFLHDEFVERLAGLLSASGLPPHLLELELTESILLRDAADTLARLHTLHGLGVRLAIDDFGIGFSSLAYLKRFPIHKLKIDGSFVRSLPGDEKDAGIVRAVLQMARALGLQVVAEGVETEVQRDFLRAEGCPLVQGFLYSPALDGASFERSMLPPRPLAVPR